ncbi:MAG: glycosyltransferase family 2 protein [Prevotellaceae bacterium]|jgi:glycosyltransferase involved in cell wall biosynthesis|nr:glycosyltransferase family 2 protein [Prevotellaceae bacterium]
MKLLTVIIPGFNEAGTIAHIIEKVLAAQLPDNIRKEIVVVDDCSTDDTGKIVRQLIAKHPDGRIRYFRHDRNRGKGYAVRTGIGKATGDAIIIQDADMEYDPDDYAALLKPLLAGESKVVYGSRVLNKENKMSYRSFYWGGRLISWATTRLFGHLITDEPTCYKLFDARLLKSIPLTSNRFGFCPEVTAKVLRAGHHIKEIPIRYYPRSKQEGKKIKWRDGVEALYLLLKYRFTARQLLKNVALLLPALLLVYYVLALQPAYHWSYDMLTSYRDFIEENPHATFDEKMKLKLGASYDYLHYVRQTTPPDAVILYPSAEAFRKPGSPFTQEIYNKLYATRFLYPRKLVTEEELSRGSRYATRITHVAIVNGVSPRSLAVPFDSTYQHVVIPVQHQPVNP